MSRAELIQICKELEIESEGFLAEELVKKIKEEADKKFSGTKVLISADNLSTVLKRFLTGHYDYVLRDKNGNELDCYEKIIGDER